MFQRHLWRHAVNQKYKTTINPCGLFFTMFLPSFVSFGIFYNHLCVSKEPSGRKNPHFWPSCLVGKHFLIILNFSWLIACLHCCLLMSFVFACFVVTDLCRSGCIQNYYLPPPHRPSLPPSLFFFVPTLNSLFNTSDFIWNQCAPKAGFGAV